MKHLICITFFFALFTSSTAAAATISYTDRVSFEAALGTTIVDDYSAAGYDTGDKVDTLTLDIHTNASMSSILGETDYFTTGFDNHNLIIPNAGNPFYCAGCNGSFELGFTTTSVGNSDGVFGAGFDIRNTTSYFAFVTFGDNSTANYDLGGFGSFFALTSDILIKSIHLGLINGGTTQVGSLSIDNLTIGSDGSEVPEPGSLVLLGLGSVGALLIRRRKAVA